MESPTSTMEEPSTTAPVVVKSTTAMAETEQEVAATCTSARTEGEAAANTVVSEEEVAEGEEEEKAAIMSEEETKEMLETLARQLNYYFSSDNLCRDTFLQSIMSQYNGYVPLTVVAGFSNVKKILGGSTDVELNCNWVAEAVNSISSCGEELEIVLLRQRKTGSSSSGRSRGGDQSSSSGSSLWGIGPRTDVDLQRYATSAPIPRSASSQGLVAPASPRTDRVAATVFPSSVPNSPGAVSYTNSPIPLSPLGLSSSLYSASSVDEYRERNVIFLRDAPSATKESDVAQIFASEDCGIPKVESIHADVANCWYVHLETNDKSDIADCILKLRGKTILGDAIKARLKTDRVPLDADFKTYQRQTSVGSVASNGDVVGAAAVIGAGGEKRTKKNNSPSTGGGKAGSKNKKYHESPTSPKSRGGGAGSGRHNNGYRERRQGKNGSGNANGGKPGSSNNHKNPQQPSPNDKQAHSSAPSGVAGNEKQPSPPQGAAAGGRKKNFPPPPPLVDNSHFPALGGMEGKRRGSSEELSAPQNAAEKEAQEDRIQTAQEEKKVPTVMEIKKIPSMPSFGEKAASGAYAAALLKKPSAVAAPVKKSAKPTQLPSGLDECRSEENQQEGQDAQSESNRSTTSNRSSVGSSVATNPNAAPTRVKSSWKSLGDSAAKTSSVDDMDDNSTASISSASTGNGKTTEITESSTLSVSSTGSSTGWGGARRSFADIVKARQVQQSA